MRSLDGQLLRLARTRGHSPARERAVARFSTLGEHGVVWLAIAGCGYAVDAPRRAGWARMAQAVGASYVANLAVKLAVRRPRPRLQGLPQLTGTPTQLSFPSAHAATSFAGARCCALLGVGAAPAYALALGLALSRVYLGVHYPSDTLAGALLGTAVAGALGPGAAEGPGARSAAPGALA